MCKGFDFGLLICKTDVNNILVSIFFTCLLGNNTLASISAMVELVEVELLAPRDAMRLVEKHVLHIFLLDDLLCDI